MSAKVIQPNEGEFLNVCGDNVRILIDSKMSGGTFLMFENHTDPGMGPPLHRHDRDDEAWFVVDGTVKFVIDGKEHIVTAGCGLYAPRGSVHTFRNIGKTRSHMIITCTPGGLEVPFREAHQLGLDQNISPETLSAAFKKFDLEFVGPPLGG